MMITTSPVTREIQDYMDRKGKCTHCGGYAQRTKTISETYDPKSRNGDGSLRTIDRIKSDLAHELAAWGGRPLAHERCERKAAGLPPKFKEF